MDYDKILDQAKLVLTFLEKNQLNDQKKRDEMTEKCKYLIDKTPNIYKMCISGGMDIGASVVGCPEGSVVGWPVGGVTLVPSDRVW